MTNRWKTFRLRTMKDKIRSLLKYIILCTILCQSITIHGLNLVGFGVGCANQVKWFLLFHLPNHHQNLDYITDQNLVDPQELCHHLSPPHLKGYALRISTFHYQCKWFGLLCGLCRRSLDILHIWWSHFCHSHRRSARDRAIFHRVSWEVQGKTHGSI